MRWTRQDGGVLRRSWWGRGCQFVERPCRSARFAWPPSQRPTIVVIEVERALYDLSLLNNELDIIEQEIDADNLADEMHTRLYAMQLDLCQRLAFFCDSVAGFGRCPPDTLAAMIALEGQLDSILDGIDAEMF